MDDRFINRWCDRYVVLWAKHGENVARAWMRGFINEEDVPRVLTELSKRSRKK